MSGTDSTDQWGFHAGVQQQEQHMDGQEVTQKGHKDIHAKPSRH